jgi:hypothetical protein
VIAASRGKAAADNAAVFLREIPVPGGCRAAPSPAVPPPAVRTRVRPAVAAFHQTRATAPAACPAAAHQAVAACRAAEAYRAGRANRQRPVVAASAAGHPLAGTAVVPKDWSAVAAPAVERAIRLAGAWRVAEACRADLSNRQRPVAAASAAGHPLAGTAVVPKDWLATVALVAGRAILLEPLGASLVVGAFQAASCRAVGASLAGAFPAAYRAVGAWYPLGAAAAARTVAAACRAAFLVARAGQTNRLALAE